MRLLVVAPFAPEHAATHGGGAYLHSLCTALAARCDLGLVAFPGSQTPPAEPHGASPIWRWRALVPPAAPRQGMARLPHQLRMLWRWRRLPLVAAKNWHAGIAAAIARARTEWRPDAALVEMAQMAQYLPALSGVASVLTDHENGCPANTRTGLGPLGDRRDRALWARYVQRFYPLADIVQALTPEDASDLERQIGRRVEVRPPACAVPAAPAVPAAAPPRALFLGDYRHAPNPEAARRLVRDVLPRLRAAIPAAELWLAGPHSDDLRDLVETPGVRLVGFVPDLHALFCAVRLVLAPVWSGGGVRMKNLAALAHGVPVVTNARGARGVAVPPTARAIAETPDELAAAAARWLADADAAGAAGRAAYAWARHHLAADAIAAQQLARIEALRARR